jgi:hypothetical protein
MSPKILILILFLSKLPPGLDRALNWFLQRPMRVSTSTLGLYRFSLANANTVSSLIPISLHQKTTFSRFLNPSEWPSCFYLFLMVAYLLLPSMIMATDLGIFPVLRTLINSRWYQCIRISS